MVTGSGVHSGDDGVGMEGRLEVDTEWMALTHAFCLYIYLILTVITVILLFRHRAPQAAKRAGVVLIVAILIQWAIGVIQFRLGIPRWTVPVHIAMSSVVTAFTALLWSNGMIRSYGTLDLITGSPRGDEKYALRRESLAARV